jgi:SAM-dependent methyltransferase
MEPIYQADLAYIQSTAFENLARGAAPDVIRILKNASTPIRRVVDVGCGSGPLTKALLDSGFQVTGIDPSTELLKIARKTISAQFVNASIYDVSLPPCEAVVAIGEPLTYHSQSADVDGLIGSFFKRVSSGLPRGGVFIFDLIENGEPSLAGRSWRSGEDWAVLVTTTEAQNERWLIRNIETFRRVGDFYRRGREIHPVHLFDGRIVSEQLTACGFAVETAVSYGKQPLAPRRRAFFATKV